MRHKAQEHCLTSSVLPRSNLDTYHSSRITNHQIIAQALKNPRVLLHVCFQEVKQNPLYLENL